MPYKKAAAASMLRQIQAEIPDDLRDRALILTGFASALWRSVLAATRAARPENTERELGLILPADQR
jgi:hypothetical protein